MGQFTKNRRRHLPVLFVFIGLILFVNLFSATNYQLMSVMVNLKVDFGYPAQTKIVLPPVGQIGAPTHWLPVRLSLELRSVDLALLETFVFSPSINSPALLDGIREGAFRILFALKIVALGAAGSIFLLYLAGARKSKTLIWGGVSGALVVVFLVIMLYFTYDLSGFERLEYEGMIEAAPWVLNLAWDAFGQVEELGERVQVLASNLYSLLREVENLGPLGLVHS